MCWMEEDGTGGKNHKTSDGGRMGDGGEGP